MQILPRLPLTCPGVQSKRFCEFVGWRRAAVRRNPALRQSLKTDKDGPHPMATGGIANWQTEPPHNCTGRKCLLCTDRVIFCAELSRCSPIYSHGLSVTT